MTLPAAVFDNIVPVSEFSRGGASRAFKKAQGDTPVVVMKNNKPLAVITSPDEYAYLSETEEDFVLLSESIIRLARNDTKPGVPFGEVLAELGMSQDELDAMDDVEIE